MSISRVPPEKEKEILHWLYNLNVISLSYLSENIAIKQHLIIKYNNSTNQLASSNVRKILTDIAIVICKNNNKKRSQIQEEICIKNKNWT